jgi:putative DNA primase/helicase
VTNFTAIPEELRELPRWVVWRWGEIDQKTGKRKKPPFRAEAPALHASSTIEATWGTFAQALKAVENGRADGIGFALGPPYVGVDLDEELSESDQGAVMVALNSYSERSVSGTGYHVVVKAHLNGRGRHPHGIGVFQEGRLFYFSGEHVEGMPASIEERQAELDRVLEQFLPKRDFSTAEENFRAKPVDVDDQELLERARRAENGAKFSRLYDDGDWQAGYSSQSEADLALCNMLSFWTGRDAGRIDHLFRRSGLMRGKWLRGDYRERTIGAAIAATKEVFQPLARNAGSTPKDGLRPPESVESVADSEGETEEDGLTDSALEESVGPESVPPCESEGVRTDSDPESVAASGRPFALPILEFIAFERPKADPLIADADGRAVVGRHSLILLGSLGGHGKTTFSIDVFLHLAAGVDYPPFTVPHPVSILMIENEGPEELFAEKLKVRLATFPHELKARLDVCTVDWGGFSLASTPLLDRLTEEIAEKQYDLVFGDPLDSLGIAGVGSPEDTRQFLALMKETGLNKTVAWWLNTHPRKEETKEALNEISGAWGGKPDSVLLLRMLSDDRTQVRFPKLRWTKRGKRPTILLAFDPDTEAFSYIGEESEEERDYLAEITALLDDRRWRIAKEIAMPKGRGGIGANVDTIKDVLAEHPDVFESRTGEAAQKLGRSAQATVWQLLGTSEQTTLMENDE